MNWTLATIWVSIITMGICVYEFIGYYITVQEMERINRLRPWSQASIKTHVVVKHWICMFLFTICIGVLIGILG